MKADDGDGPRSIPERDPLADLVSRSVGARIERVDVDVLAAGEGIERKRLTFATSRGPTSAIFERRPRGQILEAQLLPFLARKTDRVPIVHSRGLPPPAASLGPWLLLEYVFAAPGACEGDASEIVAAKLAIERAVANDLPALRALGVRDDANDQPELRAMPRVLLHGNLVCGNARRVERGVVLTGWDRAAIGPSVLDIAGLMRDLAARGRREALAGVEAAFIAALASADLGAGDAARRYLAALK